MDDYFQSKKWWVLLSCNHNKQRTHYRVSDIKEIKDKYPSFLGLRLAREICAVFCNKIYTEKVLLGSWSFSRYFPRMSFIKTRPDRHFWRLIRRGQGLGQYILPLLLFMSWGTVFIYPKDTSRRIFSFLASYFMSKRLNTANKLITLNNLLKNGRVFTMLRVPRGHSCISERKTILHRKRSQVTLGLAVLDNPRCPLLNCGFRGKVSSNGFFLSKGYNNSRCISHMKSEL